MEDVVDQRSQNDGPALVERARGGDRAAYDELVRRHFRGVYGIAFRLVDNHEDAEDLAQDCFVRAFERLDWYRGEGPFEGWLRRIVVHLAQDRFRRRGRRPRVGPILPAAESPARVEAVATGLAATPGPRAELEGRELRRILVEGLQRLPERLRVPLVLRTLEGLGYDEVADATGVTTNTARTQVMRARRALMRLIAPFFSEGGSPGGGAGDDGPGGGAGGTR